MEAVEAAVGAAVGAAVSVARQHGLRVEQPVSLRSTNNVVAWLRPSPVVAKIGVARERAFAIEVAFAAQLAALGAAVVGPAPELPARVHRHDDFAITFWRYHPQPSEPDIPDVKVAAALGRLHALAGRITPALKAQLPAFDDELDGVAALLRDARRIPALPDDDRYLLIRTLDKVLGELWAASPSATHAVIHGSPHPYNVLLVDGEPRFIDFETACVGPIEWDLAHTSPATVDNYVGPVNKDLLETCRNLVRVKTAAWCWADAHRGDLRIHAEMHLAYLKKTFATA